MRRYVTIGSIVVATVLAGSAAAYAEPGTVAVTAAAQPAPGPAGCPPAAQPAPAVPAAVSAVRPAVAAGEPGSDDSTSDDSGSRHHPNGDHPDGAGGTSDDNAPESPKTAAPPTPAPPTPAPPTPAPTTIPEPATPAPAATTPDAGSADAACGPDTSAATRYGWGTPNRVDEFDGALGPDWDVYDGEGHDGQGRRTPDAVAVKDGIMTINGDANGNTAGMAWNPGRKYGRWEGRVRAPVGGSTYNALMLLWPDAEDWPVGGEVDFMEMSDDKRQSTDMFLHYGAHNDQEQGSVDIDATQWHDWAVEWTPTSITAFVDGKEWWKTTNVDILPPGPMHLCIQLDWFPEGSGPVTPTRMEVAWVKQYPLNGDAAKEGVADTITVT